MASRCCVVRHWEQRRTNKRPALPSVCLHKESLQRKCSRPHSTEEWQLENTQLQLNQVQLKMWSYLELEITNKDRSWICPVMMTCSLTETCSSESIILNANNTLSSWGKTHQKNKKIKKRRKIFNSHSPFLKCWFHSFKKRILFYLILWIILLRGFFFFFIQQISRALFSETNVTFRPSVFKHERNTLSD